MDSDNLRARVRARVRQHKRRSAREMTLFNVGLFLAAVGIGWWMLFNGFMGLLGALVLTLCFLFAVLSQVALYRMDTPEETRRLTERFMQQELLKLQMRQMDAQDKAKRVPAEGDTPLTLGDDGELVPLDDVAEDDAPPARRAGTRP